VRTYVRVGILLRKFFHLFSLAAMEPQGLMPDEFDRRTISQVFLFGEHGPTCDPAKRSVDHPVEK
jgi:hypothetical protein